MRIKVWSPAAFSFPEVLVSVGILAFAISALIIFFINSVALDEASRNTTIALSHANVVLEDIRNSTFSSLAENIGEGDWNWGPSAISAKGLLPLKNESITTVSSGTTLLVVTVTVIWNDAAGRSRNVVLTTMTGGA